MAFPHRFLIDECLSPRLADLDIAAVQTSHVNFRGLGGQPDGVIARWCVDHDHVLVTNNGRDFRRLYARLLLHPGVVVFVPNVDRDRQCALFAIVVPALLARPHLINLLIEVALDGSLTFTDWPPA